MFAKEIAGDKTGGLIEPASPLKGARHADRPGVGSAGDRAAVQPGRAAGSPPANPAPAGSR